MKAFTDDKGREWQISLNVGSVRRVKDQLPDCDLLQPSSGEPPLFTRLSVDDALLCGVLFAVLEPQAKQAGISPEEFAEGMGGKPITAAAEAFMEEWRDFFHCRRRPAFAEMIRRQLEIVVLTQREAAKAVEAIDMTKAEERITQIFGAHSLNGPESLASSPGGSQPAS